MSETDDHNLSILLPEASVAVYARDPEIRQAADEIPKDWRFARVKIRSADGDATTAAKDFTELASPDILIVQTDNIDESFTAQLDELAGSCDESTAAIVIGPVNDVYLYRKLIDMGVSDYLVRPVDAKILSNVIARALIDRKGMSASRLIAFVGAKGGVGATSLAVASAWGASELLGHKTALIDAAGGWSTLSVKVGFEPTTTLSSAARASAAGDEDSLKRMIFGAGDKFGALATGGDAMLSPPIAGAQMESLIDTMMLKYPVVIADLSHAPWDILKMIVSRANQVVIVSTPALSSLRLARALVQEIRELRGKDAKGMELVINMQGISPATEPSRKDIEQAMEMKIAAAIPFAPKIFMSAENESKKLTQDKEGAQIVRSHLLPLLTKSLGGSDESASEEAAKSGLLGSILGKKKK